MAHPYMLPEQTYTEMCKPVNDIIAGVSGLNKHERELAVALVMEARTTEAPSAERKDRIIVALITHIEAVAANHEWLRSITDKYNSTEHHQ